MFQRANELAFEVEPVHPDAQFCRAGQLLDLPKLVRGHHAVTPGVDPWTPTSKSSDHNFESQGLISRAAYLTLRRGSLGPSGHPAGPGIAPGLVASPDERVPHFPAGACGCGADLAAAADLGVAASCQIVDIPLQTPTVTQHDLHEVACRCGRVHRAGAPAGPTSPGR